MDTKVRNVLFVTPWYPTVERPTRGTYVHEYAKAADRVARIAVLHMDTTQLRRRMYEVERDRSAGIPTWRVRWTRPRLLPKFLFRALATVVGYRRITRSWGRPDIIHAHVYSAGVLAVLIGRLTGTPVVITEHSAKFDRPRPPLVATISARVAFRFADQVLPVSSYLQAVLESRGFPGRFRVVPNVVDTNLFHAGDGPRDGIHRLLFVGALRGANGKGLPTLLQACRVLAQRDLDFHLVVIGDGPRRRDCEALVTEFHLTDRVSFLGEVPKREVAKAMRESTVFVSASGGESFCCPLAEAQASGLPSVATDVGASRETLSPEAGVLVPRKNPVALANAVHSVLVNPTRWDQRIIEARAQRFSPEAVSVALASVYTDALSRSKSVLNGIPAMRRGEPT